MPLPFDPRRIRPALFLAGLLALGACNSGSDDADDPAPEPPAPSIPDPMAGYQWYLKNTGQDVLAGERPVAGVDLNMGTLYEDGIRGKGVVVAVVDDGLDVDHEDLAANADGAGSINFYECGNQQDLNTCAAAPLLDPKYPDNAHGTGVGGLIGMVAMNGKGGRGVAPEVRLKSFNLLNERDEDDDDDDDGPDEADEARYQMFALGDGNKRAVDVDVFNMSYGGDDVVMPTEDEDGVLESLERVLASTRGGKGGLYIKSSGNQFGGSRSHPRANCRQAAQYDVGCFDAATDPDASLMGIVLTAAVNAAGQRSSYSSEGAPVWVSGFGGEYNADPAYDKTASGVEIQPALFSTDWGGCGVGHHMAGQEPINAIDNGTASTIDPACNYTASFNGTSAAAPTVSGIAALVLQTRPELKARDVHYVLAKSARHPGNWQQPGALPHPERKTDEGRVFDAGWHVNAQGLHFSRWFGYGLANARAAVEMAKTFEPLPASVTAEAETPDGAGSLILYAADRAVGPTESSLAVTVNQDIAVERVQIAFETTHKAPRRLLVTLQSPSGTRIPALLPYTSLEDTANAFEVSILGVNGFLDESARGEWRLYVEDMLLPYSWNDNLNPDTDPQVTSFAIRILGHAPAAR